MQQQCLDLLKELTGKKHIILTDRGNISIKLALCLMKEIGVGNVILQDQAGWITYKQFAKSYRLNFVELSTNYGIVDDFKGFKIILKKINKKNHKPTALLINSMPAYAYLQDMGKIKEFSEKNHIIIINDATGSIGTEEAKYGDIILGSFGNNKPVNLGYGGFIATDNKEFYGLLNDFNRLKVIFDYDLLYERLVKLKERISLLQKIHQKIKSELKSFKIIHKDKQGFNVIVKYKNEPELSLLKGYCEKNKYEFVLCPKYIKVLEQAISIEVIRL